MESWNRPLLELEPGDLVLYCDRLAEVIKSGRTFDPAVLEVTDEGGIIHSYTITSTREVKFLGRKGECVLDDVMHATVPPTDPEELRRRIAEEWLADPRVGDMFQIQHGELLEIVEIGEAGSIWAAIGFPLKERNIKRAVTGLHYNGARELRKSMAKKTRPVYHALAVGTMRADFQDHELIRHYEKSPLWTGELPSEQISKERQVK